MEKTKEKKLGMHFDVLGTYNEVHHASIGTQYVTGTTFWLKYHAFYGATIGLITALAQLLILISSYNC